jgi:hypothetical protein
MIKLAWLLIPFLVIGAAFSACGGGDDDGGTIRVGDEEIDIPDDVDVDSSGDSVPDGFPDDFPVYDGADVVSGFRGEQDGEEGFYVVWETDDSVEDVQAFYESAFEDGPWTSEGTIESGSTVILSATHEEDQLIGGVTLAEVDGKTQISAFVGDDSSGDSSSDDGSSDGDSSSDNGDEDESSGDGDSSGDSADLPDEADLNDNYPEDEIPLPDNARVTSSSSFSSGGNSSVFAEIYVEAPVDEVAEYYESTLASAGYSESFKTESDGEVFLTYSKDTETFSGDSAIVNITPSDVEGYTLVNITVTNAEGEGQ